MWALHTALQEQGDYNAPLDQELHHATHFPKLVIRIFLKLFRDIKLNRWGQGYSEQCKTSSLLPPYVQSSFVLDQNLV